MTRNEETSCSNCSIRPDVNCFSNTFFDYNYFFDNSKFFNVNNENFVIIFDLKYYVVNVYVAGNKNIYFDFDNNIAILNFDRAIDWNYDIVDVNISFYINIDNNLVVWRDK